MVKIVLKWLFLRIFGLLDLPKFITVIKKKKNKELTHFGTITVSNDTQIAHEVEPMDAGKQTCPTWYSTRLFRGTETTGGIHRSPEYWVGIRETFLAPVIPIPICADEKVFKIGDSDAIYHESFKKYGRFYSLLNHRSEYTHRIIEEADVEFENSDVSYSNDEIWSAY
jgi:hypothetical protein